MHQTFTIEGMSVRWNSSQLEKDVASQAEAKTCQSSEKQCTRLKMSTSLRIPILDEIRQLLFSSQLRTEMQSWLSLSGIMNLLNISGMRPYLLILSTYHSKRSAFKAVVGWKSAFASGTISPAMPLKSAARGLGHSRGKILCSHSAKARPWMRTRPSCS